MRYYINAALMYNKILDYPAAIINSKILVLLTLNTMNEVHKLMTGISTGCLYPTETEDALRFLTDNGVKELEIFVNTYKELFPPFSDEIKRIVCGTGTKVISVHPFSSAFESFMVFADYQRRFDDALELYKRHFEFAVAVGAQIVVFHGIMNQFNIDFGFCCERLWRLANEAERFGLTLAQENVNFCKSQSPEYIKRLKNELPEIKFVLDVKQAVRAQVNPFDMLEAMGEAAVLLHLSDNGPAGDCLLPGKGTFDFARFLKRADELGAGRNRIIEIYSGCYSSVHELLESMLHLQAFGK